VSIFRLKRVSINGGDDNPSNVDRGFLRAEKGVKVQGTCLRDGITSASHVLVGTAIDIRSGVIQRITPPSLQFLADRDKEASLQG